MEVMYRIKKRTTCYFRSYYYCTCTNTSNCLQFIIATLVPTIHSFQFVTLSLQPVHVFASYILGLPSPKPLERMQHDVFVMYGTAEGRHELTGLEKGWYIIPKKFHIPFAGPIGLDDDGVVGMEFVPQECEVNGIDGKGEAG